MGTIREDVKHHAEQIFDETASILGELQDKYGKVPLKIALLVAKIDEATAAIYGEASGLPCCVDGVDKNGEVCFECGGASSQ